MKLVRRVCLTLLIVSPASWAQVTGVVRYATGNSVAGAMVKVKSADSRLTYLVVSQEQGRYSTPKLPPGKYTVQGFGGVYQSSSTEIGVDSAGATADISLNSLREVRTPARSLTDAEYVALMPEGEAKKILLTKCVVCHGPGNFISRPGTRKEWEQRLNEMVYYLGMNRNLQVEFNSKMGIDAAMLTSQERELITDYLAKYFNPETAPPVPPVPPPFGSRFPVSDPNQHIPMTLQKSKYVAMELDLNPVQVGSFAIDPQGRIWVSEKTTGALGRFDPKSHQYTRLAPATAEFTKDDFGAVGVDPQGMVWFTSTYDPFKGGLGAPPQNAKWFQYDPKSSKVVREYEVPIPNVPGGDILYNTFAFPPDGSVWVTQTAKHHLVKLDPSTGKVTPYPLRVGQHTFGITVGGDKMIWSAGDNDNVLLRVDPKNGEMTKYALPTVKYDSPFPSLENYGEKPWRVAADSDGNIWATTLAGKLVKTDYRTGKMIEFTPPTHDALGGLDIDIAGKIVWFGGAGVPRISRFDPAKNSFAEFPLTSAGQRPWIISVDPANRNRIWWNSRDGRIGYLELTD